MRPNTGCLVSITCPIIFFLPLGAADYMSAGRISYIWEDGMLEAAVRVACGFLPMSLAQTARIEAFFELIDS